MKLSKTIGFSAFLLGASLLTGCGADDAATTEDKNAQKVKTSQDEVVDSKEESNNVISVNQVIADNDLIKATLAEIETLEDDTWGDERKVVFDVENKSGQNITIQSEGVSSDGRMVKEEFITMSQDIAAGKTAECVLSITPFDEEMPSLEESFEMTLKVISADYEDLGNYEVKVDVANK